MKLKIRMLIGNLSGAFVNFLIIFTLAQFDTVEEVGKYTFVFAVLSPFFIFINMKLRSVITTDVKNDISLDMYFNYRILTLLLMIVFTTILVLLMDSKYYFYGFLIILFKSMEIISEFLYGIWQRSSNFIEISNSLILKNTLASIVFFGVYIYQKDFSISFVSLLIIYFIFLIRDFYKVNLNKSITFKICDFKKLFLLTFSLGLGGLVASLNINLPRYFLEWNFSEYEVGIFSTLSYFLVVLNIYISSLGQIFLPKLANLYVEENFKRFNSTLLKAILSASIYGLVVYILTNSFSYQLVSVLLGDNYKEYHEILTTLVLGAIFLYSTVYLGTALNAMRRFNIQLFINIFVMIIIIIFSQKIIPESSIKGAADVVLYSNIAIAMCYLLVYLIVIGGWKREIIEKNNK